VRHGPGELFPTWRCHAVCIDHPYALVQAESRHMWARGPAASVRGVAAVTEYFAELDPPVRAAFEHVWDLAREVAPDAEEGVSYGLAALLFHGKPLLGFKAARGHLSVFPFSPQAVDAVRAQLSGYELAKGTVRFTVGHPLPDEAVRAMVAFRRDEIDGPAD
jgi:uncharacterized protein YdhG (YjbR/CyaY superfamily)